MSDDKEIPFCMNCGKAMKPTDRSGVEPETVYRCEPCNVETWVGDDTREPSKRN